VQDPCLQKRDEEEDNANLSHGKLGYLREESKCRGGAEKKPAQMQRLQHAKAGKVTFSKKFARDR
jgi:hypothetical protein